MWSFLMYVITFKNIFIYCKFFVLADIHYYQSEVQFTSLNHYGTLKMK